METIGQRLKRLRTSKGLTQAQLARAAGLSSQSSIGNIENDTRGFGASILKIAEILEVSPDYLQTGIDKQHLTSSNITPGPNLKGKGKYQVALIQVALIKHYKLKSAVIYREKPSQNWAAKHRHTMRCLHPAATGTAAISGTSNNTSSLKC